MLVRLEYLVQCVTAFCFICVPDACSLTMTQRAVCVFVCLLTVNKYIIVLPVGHLVCTWHISFLDVIHEEPETQTILKSVTFPTSFSCITQAAGMCAQRPQHFCQCSLSLSECVAAWFLLPPIHWRIKDYRDGLGFVFALPAGINSSVWWSDTFLACLHRRKRWNACHHV